MSLALCDSPVDSTVEELQWVARASRTAPLRTIEAFAEQEIVLPTGPEIGRRFKCSTQPFTGLLFRAMMSAAFMHVVLTGPRQSSKTLVGFVLPIMYHLFEIGETVIAGVPRIEMAMEKWHDDLLPVIRASGYRDLLPKKGTASKGGSGETISFRNGADLKFASFSSSAPRPGITARVLVCTEIDNHQTIGTSRDEGDMISALVACTRAFGSRARTYMECITTIEQSRIVKTIKLGSGSKILMPCPHCRKFVLPEREHVKGWEDAPSVLAAERATLFCCPSCGRPWTEPERMASIDQALLVHRGQSVRRLHGVPTVVGKGPDTDTLGVRWTACHNTFVNAGTIGADLWNAARDEDTENAEKNLCQIVFATPYVPPVWEVAAVTRTGILSRMTKLPRGRVPDWAEYITVGMDLGKWMAYYLAIAWNAEARGHIIDYGSLEVRSRELGEESATLATLRTFRDETCLVGWAQSESANLKPIRVFIDRGWPKTAQVVQSFCRESGKRFLPTLGRGATQMDKRNYSAPKRKGALVRHVGDGYHVSWVPANRVHVVTINADQWKTFLHERLACDLEKSASPLTLFSADPRQHRSLTEHLTAEREVEKFVLGRGTIRSWIADRKTNHFFDCAYQACTAGHFAGARLAVSKDPVATVERPVGVKVGVTMPDGRPFVSSGVRR